MKILDIKQRTPEWHQIRKGTITGKELGRLMSKVKTARNGALYKLIGGRLSTRIETEDGDYESPIERGHRLEPLAVAEYEFLTGNKVHSIGFALKEDSDHIGNSPDGFTENGIGGIEIKCPEEEAYVRYWFENLETKTIPPEHYWQVIQYFVVNEKMEYLDFIVYNPDITVKPIFIIRVYRNDLLADIEKAQNVQEDAINQVDRFLETVITF